MTREMGSLGSGRSRLLRRARLEDFRARRALGIFQLAVLRHDRQFAQGCACRDEGFEGGHVVIILKLGRLQFD